MEIIKNDEDVLKLIRKEIEDLPHVFKEVIDLSEGTLHEEFIFSVRGYYNSERDTLNKLYGETKASLVKNFLTLISLGVTITNKDNGIEINEICGCTDD